MFVFPAFDENYKGRKRTFKCCRKCRSKRMKCTISSIDFEIVGCDNCQKLGLKCDLIKNEESSSNKKKTTRPSAPKSTTPVTEPLDSGQLPSVLQNDVNFPFGNDFLSQYQPIMNPLITSPCSKGNKEESMEDITGEYLYKKYNFVISLSTPKYLINKIPINGNSTNDIVQTRKLKLRPDQNHIKNSSFYHFLQNINAFQLNSPGFVEITPTDLIKLIQIYFFKINSILPVIEEEEFWKSYQQNTISSIIVYSIVLIISNDDLAKPILMKSLRNCDLTKFETHLQKYQEDLEFKIRQLLLVLPELGDIDKLNRLITHVLILLQFGFNNYASEQSSQDLTDAINNAMSLLIHFQSLHDKLISEGLVDKLRYLGELFWTLFILDRFNAMINFKAMFIKREDFNVQLPIENEYLMKLVKVTFSLEDMLVSVYQPKNNLNQNTPSGNNKLFEENDFFLQQNFINYNPNNQVKQVNEYLPGYLSLQEYQHRTVFFIEKSIESVIFLGYRSKELKVSQYQVIDQQSLAVASNIKKYFNYLTENQTKNNLLINISIIPLIISIFFSVPITSKMKLLSKLKGKLALEITQDNVEMIEILLNDYLAIVQNFTRKWWFIEDVIRTLHKMNKQMKKLKNHSYKKNKKWKIAYGDTNALPSIPLVSSPHYYSAIMQSSSESEDEPPVARPKTISPAWLTIPFSIPKSLWMSSTMNFPWFPTS